MTEFPELGCYGLAGHATDPHILLDEAHCAERLGLGAIFLSERFNTKEAFALAAAAADAGRDPAAIRIWSVLAVVDDTQG
ncbi:hypothetical protein [Nocardia grenadensis]